MIRSTLIPLCLASLAALPASAATATANAPQPRSEACTPLTVAAQGEPGAGAPSWSTRAAQIRSSAIYQLGGEGGGSLLDGTEPCWDAERNLVRVDFGGRTVPARDLAYLLTTPDLLPAFAYGGLVIADATVAGTLRLERVTLGYPLELRELVFADPRSDEVRGRSRELVLHIDSSTLKQPVEVVGSHLNGLALIENSRFDESLNFSGNAFHAAAGGGGAAEEEGAATRSRSLQILYTEIGGKLRLTNNRFDGRVFLDHSDVAYTEVEDNGFAAGMFAVRKNRIGKLSLERNAFGGGLAIANNRVETLLDVVDGEIGPVEGTDELGIHVNRIGGTVYFGPAKIAPEVKRLDLTFNEITGPADIVLPAAWPPAAAAEGRGASYHSLDLTSTEVGSRLALQLPEAGPGAAAGDADDAGPGGGRAAERADDPDAYCYERANGRPAAVVWLTNATLDTLAWRLPRGCRYAWAGTGLTYKSLGGSNMLDAPERERATPEEGPHADGPPPLAFLLPSALAAADPPVGADSAAAGAAAGPDDERALRDAWRYAMAEPNPDALTFLAQHLRARGEFTESREALMEAKRLDYTPPDRCFVELPFAAAVTLFDALDRDCLTRGAGYMFLFPTGFGVKPERAFLWLIGGWFAGWALYSAYHYRRRWAHGWRPHLAALRRRLAEPGRRRRGASNIEGFARYDAGKNPEDFRLWIFSADAMLPVVNLHTYEAYFPESFGMRLVSYAQNVLGWFVVTSLFAALTVL